MPISSPDDAARLFATLGDPVRLELLARLSAGDAISGSSERDWMSCNASWQLSGNSGKMR